MSLKQTMGSAGSEVHTGTREAKGQRRVRGSHRGTRGQGPGSQHYRTGGSEIRAGFLEEVAARLSSHRKTQAKSRGGLPARARAGLGAEEAEGLARGRLEVWVGGSPLCWPCGLPPQPVSPSRRLGGWSPKVETAD